MQQLVIDAFTQLQQQQERLLRSLQLQQWQQRRQQQQQQQRRPSGLRHAAGSHAFLDQSSTLLPTSSQQHPIHQQALPCAQTCGPLSTNQPSLVLQFSAAHQGFNQPPGAPCSMPQSSRRNQLRPRTLPDGRVALCSFAPAACQAAAQGRAARPTAPANSPDSSQVAQQISHDQRVAEQLANYQQISHDQRVAEQLANDQQIDHDQQMDDQTVLVSFPVDLSGYKQLAPANSHSTSGKIAKVSLVTCTSIRGSKESTMTRRRLYITLHLTSLTHAC